MDLLLQVAAQTSNVVLTIYWRPINYSITLILPDAVRLANKINKYERNTNRELAEAAG